MAVANVAGLTVDNSITKTGGTYSIGSVSATAASLVRTEGSLDFTRPCFAFDTGAVIPAGSTINSVSLQLRLISWLTPGDGSLIDTWSLRVSIAKDFNAFGAAVEAVSTDYAWVESQILVGSFEPTTSPGTKTFVLPSSANSRIATAADIDTPDTNPNQNGWTEVSLTDESFIQAGFESITSSWASANHGTSGFRPVLIVDYTPPVGATKFNNRFSRSGITRPGFW